MAAQQNFSVDNVVVRHAKANTVRCLNIDEITKHFTSVLVGRQIFRAGVLSAVLTPIALPWVLSPLMDALGMAPHMPADFKRGAITTATLITALTAAIAFVLYVKLYRGSRGVLRIIRFFKPIARISVYLIYLYLLVPLFALLYIGHDPLIVVYAIALTINIGILVYFLRWTLKCYVDFEEAYRCVSSRAIFAPPGGENTLSFILRETFSMPPGYLIKPAGAAWIIFLGTAALALEALSFTYIWQMNQNLNYAMRFDLRNMATLTNGTLDSRAEMLSASLAIAAFPLLSVPIFALAGRVRRAARRAAVHSVSEVRAKDTRAPLVFLRSFHDDQIGVRSKKIVNVFQRVLTRGSLFSNIDELLTERFWHVGPVFAIGKPDEPLPPLGAARAYLSGEDWHTVVSELMKEARAIILVLDYTEGLLWELHHAREAGHLGKTVLLVPPDHRADTQLLAGVLSVLGADNEKIDSAAAQSAIALLPVSTGCIAALYGNCVDSYAYDLSLRLGLHAILGDRELPGELQSIFVPASLTNLTKESRMGA